MEDKLQECLDELFSVLHGNLIVGDHTSLSAFGSAEQQELGEVSKDITKLFLKQGYDIEITINLILDELKRFDIPKSKKTWNPFSKGNSIPQSSLIGQFNATSCYIEKLKTDLSLQEVQIVKETTLLENLRKRLIRCKENLQQCLEKGEKAQEPLESKSTDFKGMISDEDHWENRLQQKLNDLRISYTVAEQSLIQIELLIENNKQLSGRIRSIVSKAIPIWEEQMKTILAVTKYAGKSDANRDFEEKLMILKKMESLDQKIRDVLQDISL